MLQLQNHFYKRKRAFVTIPKRKILYKLNAYLYDSPVDCRGCKVFCFCCWHMEVGIILPGLDRGASEDLSLQALKSDADLWKTKGTGRGTNMVLCRSEGRSVSLWLRSLSVVCLRRSLAFFPPRGFLARCVGSSAGLKIGLWLSGVGSDFVSSGVTSLFLLLLLLIFF